MGLADDDFAQYHFTDDCPMPSGKKCADPASCEWDWACAIDRVMEKWETDTIVIRRPQRDQGYYHVERSTR